MNDTASMPEPFLDHEWNRIFSVYSPATVMAIGTFIIHETTYFTRFLPFYLCDFVPYLRKFKIQTGKDNEPDLLRKCLKTVIFNHACVQLPMVLLFHPIAEFLGMTIHGTPLPGCGAIAFQILLFAMVEDSWHYWAHRLLHVPWFYQNIHKQHHEYSAPFGLAAEYAHPAETFILGIGTMLGPLLISPFTHLFIVWLWLVVRLLQTVDAHSGYDFPWSLRHWFPLWAGADFHDHHHFAYLGNYATFFRYWDYFCGTDERYKLWRSKKQKAKGAAIPDSLSTGGTDPYAANGLKQE